MPVDGDEPGLCFARVDPENGGCGCVDDTEANPAAAFDLNDIGIGQGSVIGEIGIGRVANSFG